MAHSSDTVITPMDLRASMGDLLDRVRLRHETYLITRRGKPVAALIPVAKLEAARSLATKYAKLMMKVQERFNDETGADLEEIEREAEEAVARVRAKATRRRK